MRFCNLSAYVQRQINYILQSCRSFARAYINDIIIYSCTLDKYLCYLHLMFCELEKANIFIKAAKLYLGYPSVSLFGQRVNSFGLTTATEKLKAICQLKFPRIFKDLKIYLNDWISLVLYSILCINDRASAKIKDQLIEA